MDHGEGYKMKEIRDKMKEIRDKMKEIRDNCAQYPSSRQKMIRDKSSNDKR